ncbi:YncE family protein [Dokdonia sp. R78006]|uniref:YncE family protein n=1 Tax=Dokdonia sp. R78006 TaxID=3093866 RepID=UPI0036D2D4E8
MKKTIYLLSVLSLFAFSCESDDDFTEPIIEVEVEDEAYGNGFLVTNQGPFNNGFGTVSFIDEGFSAIENDIYQTVNNDNLGNIVQSIGFTEDNAYVVANIGNRLTIVDRFTFEEIARIETGLSNPRFFASVDGKGYLTNWGDGADATDDYIAVIDLATNTITNTIAVEEGPEEILYNGTYLYVTNQGGFGVNNIVTVIDPATDTVVTTIPVGDAPNGLELDSSGDLWVLAGGSPAFTGTETAGSLSAINTTTNTVSASFDFGVTDHPNSINIEGQNLYYYLNGEVFVSSTTNFAIPTTPELTGLSLFNIVVRDDILIGANPGDFSSNGTIEVYDLTSGTIITSLSASLGTDQIYFNE